MQNMVTYIHRNLQLHGDFVSGPRAPLEGNLVPNLLLGASPWTLQGANISDPNRPIHPEAKKVGAYDIRPSYAVIQNCHACYWARKVFSCIVISELSELFS